VIKRKRNKKISQRRTKADLEKEVDKRNFKKINRGKDQEPNQNRQSRKK
jgi:hypothetical protein